METIEKNNMIISRITQDDWQQYKSIRIEALKNDSIAFGTNALKEVENLNESDWRNKLADQETSFFIAYSNTKPVGLIRVTFNDEEVDTDTAYLGSLYVNKAFRRSGIASLLVDAVIDESKKTSGISKIRLWVGKLQIHAIKLYEKFGFALVSDSEDKTELIMELVLTQH